MSVGYWYIGKVFLKIGSRAFGGWSTTAVILEQELIEKNQLITKEQLSGAIAYSQILPGAVQVLIISNIGYQLKGALGAAVATTSYLFPAFSLITIFSFIYFGHLQNSPIVNSLGGITAALAGIILANGYRIGRGHATHAWMWALVMLAFGAKVWLRLNAALIILAFGIGALLCYPLVKKD